MVPDAKQETGGGVAAQSEMSAKEHRMMERRRRVAEKFRYHAPKNDEHRENHEAVNEIFAKMADAVTLALEECHAGSIVSVHEFDVCIDKLIESRMWANSALANHVNTKG